MPPSERTVRTSGKKPPSRRRPVKPVERSFNPLPTPSQTGTGVSLAPATETRRPLIHGRPMVISSWDEEDPSFPKLKDIIQVQDPDFSLLDRKLLDVLLAFSYEGLYQNPDQVFSAPTSVVRSAVGWVKHESNNELEKSLERLQTTLIVIGYYAEGSLRRRRLTLLIMSDIPRKEGVMFWRFNPELTPMLGKPSQWARIHLNVTKQFRRAYAHRLYQNLFLYIHRHIPVWDPKIEDLRELMAATAPSLDNFAQFERKALKPAVEEINKLAPFTVHYDLEKEANSRRISKVVFTIRPDESLIPPQPAAALPRKKPRGRDQMTLDLEDGLTDAERGSKIPSTPESLLSHFGSQTRNRLSAAYPSLDIEALLNEWVRWSIGKGQKVSAPVNAFEKWVTRGPRRSARPDQPNRPPLIPQPPQSLPGN